MKGVGKSCDLLRMAICESAALSEPRDSDKLLNNNAGTWDTAASPRMGDEHPCHAERERESQRTKREETANRPGHCILL